ncbi:hypothetical protein LSAT2_015163 [Lamellibrachia satsuma]|nr:hypothetical protein LSAT2_015163 [Lamellibrachia satsuma]
MEGIKRKSYSAAVIEGVRKRARVFVGDSIVRKTDRVLNKGDDVVVCLPGAKIEAITERPVAANGCGVRCLHLANDCGNNTGHLTAHEERDRQGDAARGSALPARLAHRDAAYRPVDNDDHHVDRNTPVGCRRSGSVGHTTGYLENDNSQECDADRETRTPKTGGGS